MIFNKFILFFFLFLFFYQVRDHDHLTERYRGSAHQDCNLQYRIDPKRIKVPVIIHNLKHDAHIILQSVKRRHGDINCIPMNNETYISFTICMSIQVLCFCFR